MSGDKHKYAQYIADNKDAQWEDPNKIKNAYTIKKIDIATFNYIIQKASIDNNFVVRMVCSEMRTE